MTVVNAVIWRGVPNPYVHLNIHKNLYIVCQIRLHNPTSFTSRVFWVEKILLLNLEYTVMKLSLHFSSSTTRFVICCWGCFSSCSPVNTWSEEYLHRLMNNQRCMAFCTVCILIKPLAPNWTSSSLLLLLLLLLVDGVHLVPGVCLAYRGGVLALHHQLVGHLVFLKTLHQINK